MNFIDFTPVDKLSVSALTAREKSWIAKLQKVLAECPKRLELLTIGDAALKVIDAAGAIRSELSDDAASQDGIVLAKIEGGPLVHGVSG